MKKLITVLMCFQLIVSPLSSVALADDGPPQTNASYDAGSQHKGGYDFVLKQILTLSSSVIGANILTQCLAGMKVPSIAIYMAGGVANIVAELATSDKNIKRHQARMDEIEVTQKFMAENKSGGEVQKMAIQHRLKEEEDLRDYLKARKNWQIAISVVYAAATAAAIIEQISEVASLGVGVAVTNAGCSVVPADGGASMFSTANLLGMAWGMGTSMFGGGGQISTYGGMALGLLQLAVPSISKVVGSTYSSPMGRAISFGASMALATTVAIGLGHRHNVAEDNVGKLNKLLKQFEYDTTGPDGFELGDTNDLYSNKVVKANTTTKMLAKGATERKCLSRSGNKYDYSPKGCGSALKLNPVKFNYSGISSDLANVASMSTDLANAAASGDMARAELVAGNLAAQAGNMRNLVEKLQAEHNKRLPAGQKPVDFEKSIKDQVASLQASLEQGAVSKGMDLSTLGSGTAKLAEDTKEKSATAPTVASAPAAPEIPAAPAIPDFSLPDDMGSTDASVAEATLEEKLGDYESNESDISKKSDVSIFTQLSNRYLLNYTRIFESKDKPSESPTN